MKVTFAEHKSGNFKMLTGVSGGSEMGVFSSPTPLFSLDYMYLRILKEE